MLDNILLLATNDKNRANWSQSGKAVYPLNNEHYANKNNKIFEMVYNHIENNKTPYFALGHYTSSLILEPFYYLLINKVEKKGRIFTFYYETIRCANKPSKFLLALKDHANSLISIVDIQSAKSIVDEELWKTRVFIGSSSESKDTAISIGKILQEKYGESIVLKPWWNMFKSKDITFLKLIKIAKVVDKAIFVLSDDDNVKSRDNIKPAPRDNVIFEYGLFVGLLGKDNVDICCKKGIKIPTDISGLTYIGYKGNIKNDFNALEELSNIYK